MLSHVSNHNLIVHNEREKFNLLEFLKIHKTTSFWCRKSEMWCDTDMIQESFLHNSMPQKGVAPPLQMAKGGITPTR